MGGEGLSERWEASGRDRRALGRDGRGGPQ